MYIVLEKVYNDPLSSAAAVTVRSLTEKPRGVN